MTERRAGLAAGALVGLLLLVTLWNAASYPPGLGYDAVHHVEYAEGLVPEGRIPGPEQRGEYYTPPLFYAVSGTAILLGEAVGLGEPLRAAQAANAAIAVGTALLLLLLARLLFPGRHLLHLGALAYFALVPVVAKATAMFHPEPLSMFLSTAALLLFARIALSGAYRWPHALALGAVLGAGQLVRAFALWTFAAVGLALVAVLATQPEARRRVLAFTLVALVGTAAVAGPWYVRQATRYDNPIFDPQPSVQTPLWERRPASFYLDPGLPELFTHPYRPAFANLAVPQTYAELWGDWYGVWAWNSAHADAPEPAAERSLALQHAAGLLPSALAVAGWAALLALALRRRLHALLAVALLPGFGILGYLYFTVSYPTPDGDVLKATYMLTTAPAWALGFGFALERLARVRLLGPALLVVLGLCALVSLRFVIHGAV